MTTLTCPLLAFIYFQGSKEYTCTRPAGPLPNIANPPSCIPYLPTSDYPLPLALIVACYFVSRELWDDSRPN